MAKIDEIRKIVTESTMAKIDGVKLDSFSASAIVKVYDNISEENRTKFVALPIEKMVKVAFKLLS